MYEFMDFSVHAYVCIYIQPSTASTMQFMYTYVAKAITDT